MKTVLDSIDPDNYILSLSSGFFGFFAHCGFVKAIFSEGLNNPKLITGSSAGAIVAACLGSGLSITEIEKEFLSISKEKFWDPAFGAGFLKGDIFEKNMIQILKPKLAESKWPLHIATYDILKRQTYIFEDGDLPRIVRASCAVPLFFHPVKINNRYYWDGGIKDKMAWQNLNQSKDTVLGHCLPSDKISSLFESKKTFEYRNRHLLTIKNLPPTGPGYFENGKKSIDLAYEQTKLFLQFKV